MSKLLAVCFTVTFVVSLRECGKTQRTQMQLWAKHEAQVFAYAHEEMREQRGLPFLNLPPSRPNKPSIEVVPNDKGSRL